MRRVVSVCFPHWPTDRLRRHRAKLGADIPPSPLVTARHNGRRRVVVATDGAALALGLRPGFAIAHALALVPNLHVAEAEPQADADALRRLALWCHRYTPLAAVDGVAGLWLDVTGCSSLFGTETALLGHMLARFEANGFQARAALADTPGAAHALARFGPPALAVVPPGAQGPATAPLPVASLRLAPGMDAVLRRLGFEQVGDLVCIPRALLAQRFGPLLGLRLDQIHGHVHEPLVSLLPESMRACRTTFAEPLLTVEALHAAAGHLVGSLCQAMERDGVGARRLDLVFERVDRGLAAIRIGTVHPSQNARHLLRLLHERFDTVDPGEGIEAMHLLAPLTSPLRWEQQDGTGAQNVALLVDRLVNRLGHGRVYRAIPLQTATPEQAAGKGPAMIPKASTAGGHSPAPTPVPAVETSTANKLRRPTRPSVRLIMVQDAPVQRTLVQGAPAAPSIRSHIHLVAGDLPSPEQGRACPVNATSAFVPVPPFPGDPAEDQLLPWKPRHRLEHKQHSSDLAPWPGRQPAPLRLLSPARPIQVLAELPDQPPRAFTWRRHRHLVRRADGPERIGGEWWHKDSEADTVRDYFLVEDEGGQRFWLFRQGDRLHLRTGTLEWFLHGLF